MLKQFLSNEHGATAIEYALIAAMLSLAIIGGVSSTFNAIEHMFSDNESHISTALN
ncbi:Flp family type IVb pilin [Ahrensia sp. 13_GOM-1096m]|uniref:Flp family type IVb pilin n=1 Tax=Ahrensia sp. 13_GOM-1096m TaxID=1380380 RepID=UPI000479EDDA|nr:Flp family type IVb pilin [Ahrensia sp. 13_GOM-1096m]